jgi:plastocyanin
MRKLLFSLVVLLALAVAQPVAAATSNVRITGTGFSPQRVTIKTGDSVRWVNRDTKNHQVVANNGAFVSPILAPGRAYTKRFTASGTYRYHDGLYPSRTGTVVVTGPPPSVSATATAGVIRYGQRIVLSGVVSSHQANQTVILYWQPYPQGSFSELTRVLTTAGGAWSVFVTPKVLTFYMVRWSGKQSQTLTIGVTPALSLLKRPDGRFFTRARAGVSYAGHFVYVQRLTAFGEWVKIAKYKLGRRSGRIFRLRLPRGRLSRIRVFMTVNQAGPGYLAGYSNVLAVRR